MEPAQILANAFRLINITIAQAEIDRALDDLRKAGPHPDAIGPHRLLAQISGWRSAAGAAFESGEFPKSTIASMDRVPRAFWNDHEPPQWRQDVAAKYADLVGQVFAGHEVTKVERSSTRAMRAQATLRCIHCRKLRRAYTSELGRVPPCACQPEALAAWQPEQRKPTFYERAVAEFVGRELKRGWRVTRIIPGSKSQGFMAELQRGDTVQLYRIDKLRAGQVPM